MELTGICVFVTDQNIEGAIKAFRRKCDFSRLKEDVHRHEFHLTRSERRKVKDAKGLRRVNKRGGKNGS